MLKIFFAITSFSNKNEKPEIPMNKIVYLGLSLLELCKILMYELWYISLYIPQDVETSFDTSN